MLKLDSLNEEIERQSKNIKETSDVAANIFNIVMSKNDLNGQDLTDMLGVNNNLVGYLEEVANQLEKLMSEEDKTIRASYKKYKFLASLSILSGIIFPPIGLSLGAYSIYKLYETRKIDVIFYDETLDRLIDLGNKIDKIRINLENNETRILKLLRERPEEEGVKVLSGEEALMFMANQIIQNFVLTGECPDMDTLDPNIRNAMLYLLQENYGKEENDIMKLLNRLRTEVLEEVERIKILNKGEENE